MDHMRVLRTLKRADNSDRQPRAGSEKSECHRGAVKKVIFAAIAAIVLSCAALVWFVTNPNFGTIAAPVQGPGADPARLRSDVETLAASSPARAFGNVGALDRIADHIITEFTNAGCLPERQTFSVGGNDYHNIVCSKGPPDAPRMVIGAHYDVAGNGNPGADDNASGVAGLLELARLLEMAKPDLVHRLDLVAFTLEEPPNFRSQTMGSSVYAGRLKHAGADVKLMISVEMIGYFSDDPGSQAYPLPGLDLIYPDTGNFIAIVGQSFDRARVSRVKALMRAGNTLPVYSINAPARVPGIDFSDHLSFWRLGYPAVMVTDTAFLRNPNYHEPTDRPETLDYRRMAKVVDGLLQVAAGF